MDLLRQLWFFLLCLGLAQTVTHAPRMVFTDTETTPKSFDSLDHPVWIFPQEESHTVTMAAGNQLISFNLKNPKMGPVRKNVSWGEGQSNPSDNNIVLVHKKKAADQLFVCGLISKGTVCCDMNLSEPSCTSSGKIKDIKEGIKYMSVQKGEPSALDESGESTDLYITHSGPQEYVGMYRFGKKRVVPATTNKEQHYVGVVLSRREEEPLQSRVYAFYREKNRDTALYSEMWLPFVTQVCMSDVGGPKGNMQFIWTSQMSARLFCGDPHSKQHFSELVDMATVHANRWQDTRIYALFRNEWGMSAVCVYTIGEIDSIFQTSSIKGDQSMSRQCVEDSTKSPQKATEMMDWIFPMNRSGPFIFNHHNYTHIQVDSSQQKLDFMVLFLSLNNGAIHKVVQNGDTSIIIAEYHPFTPRGHILSLVFHPSSKKLYVKSRDKLLQLDMARCSQYGDVCQECVLARDPYCGWDRATTQCTHYKDGLIQDVATGNHAKCGNSGKPHTQAFRARSSSEPVAKEGGAAPVTLPPGSKYFLECPISSHHAQYTWKHGNSATACSHKEERCLHLIDSMAPEHEGEHKCESTESGYTRVLAQYDIKLGSAAVSLSPQPLVWLGLVAVVMSILNADP